MNDVDVIIVGAGPVGLFLAGELLRRGHTCAIVERALGPSAHSKALAIMPRTLQLFERAGTSDAFLSEVNRVRGVRFVTPRGATLVDFENVATRYPFVSILAQHRTEALLKVRLERLGGTVLYGHEFVACAPGERGVRVTIANQTGAFEVRARYLVGCDGVHSAVRENAGIAFAGRTYNDRAVLADVRVRTGVPQDEARVHIDRTGMVTMFAMNATLRRIVVVSPRERAPERICAEWLQARLDRTRLPVKVLEEPVWSSVFGVHRRIARQMRAGNVFLAGDAAHAHSPVGGQGMNVGLEDAWTLAQVLSPVLCANAAVSSLDRYEALRLSAARAVVRHTDLLLRALAHPNRAMRIGREFLAPYVIRIPVLRDRVVRELLTA